MKTKTPKRYISLKKDELLLTVRGDASVPTHNIEDSLTVQIRKNQDGILYAFFDRRNNKTGSSYFQIWILDGVNRLIKAVYQALTPKKFYPSIEWGINVEDRGKYASFDSELRDLFGGDNYAVRYTSAKFNWQANRQFEIHNGIYV